jgi:hypothetical protein
VFRNAVGLPVAALLAAVLGLGVLGAELGWVRLGPAAGSGPQAVDGTIAPREYAHQYAATDIGMTVFWLVEGDEVQIAAQAPGAGWIAVGWGGEGPIMQGFDIVIGYVDSAGPHVADNFANDAAGHVADTELGGTSDLLQTEARETADGTVFEVRRKLDTGDDEHDRPIHEGVMPAMLAFADADDFMTYHDTHRATAQLDFLSAESAGRRLIPEHLTEYQIGVLAWVLVLAVYGAIGLVSVWLEGVEPIPERLEPHPGLGALVGMSLFAVAALAGSVWFIVQVVAGTGDALALGLSGTFWMWSLAMALALYRRYFMVAETIQQDRDEEIPW